MKYVSHSHRHADAIIAADDYLQTRYCEFIDALESISDKELIEDFCFRKQAALARGKNFKSISHSINALLKDRMTLIPGWEDEVSIFNDEHGIIDDTAWRLDFACYDGFAVEIAFNHGEAIAWNLLKPCLASELNHVQKAIQCQLGIYVCATEEMKKAGNFDSASGAFEKVIRYLPPMMNQLTIPMMIIGLEAPETFRVDSKTRDIVML